MQRRQFNPHNPYSKYRLLGRLGFCLWVVFLSSMVFAQDTIYRYTNSSGVVTFSQIPPHRRSAEALDGRCLAKFWDCNRQFEGVSWDNTPLITQRYDREIETSARHFGVDAALVRAIIHAESAFDAKAVSKAGAVGLMQLMPEIATAFEVADPFHPGDNIRGGSALLAELWQQFDGDLRLVAAGYNAGATAVIRYQGIPPYTETQRFVERVETLYQRYRRAL